MIVSTIATLKLMTTRPIIEPKIQGNHTVTQSIGPLEPGKHTIAVCHNNTGEVNDSLRKTISAYTNSPAKDAPETVNQFLTQLQKIPSVYFARITTDESASGAQCDQKKGTLNFIDINIPNIVDQPPNPFIPTDEGSDISRLLK